MSNAISTTITQRIDEVTSLKNAERYRQAGEKFLFCIDLLEISAWHVQSDRAVEVLEDRFDRINEGKCTGYELMDHFTQLELDNLRERCQHQDTMRFTGQDATRLGHLEEMEQQYQQLMDIKKAQRAEERSA